MLPHLIQVTVNQVNKMKNRIKVPLAVLVTRDDAESCMNDLALAANNQRKLLAERDALVLKINSRYESPLAECAETLTEKTDALRAWAEANNDQFPAGRKSLALVSGTLGFRTGTPKLSLVSRAWNWDKVLQIIEQMPLWQAFVRSKKEVDKESILTQRSQDPDKSTFDHELKRIGLRVSQDESFFIEPDLSKCEARQTAPVE